MERSLDYARDDKGDYARDDKGDYARDDKGDYARDDRKKALAQADAHHREVIVWLGTMTESLCLLLQRFYHLLGILEVGTSQGIEQTINRRRV